MVNKITGADLRRAREAKGWGIDKLARYVGMDKGHLSKVERGLDGRRATPKIIQAYKNALRLTAIPIPDNTNSDPEQADPYPVLEETVTVDGMRMRRGHDPQEVLDRGRRTPDGVRTGSGAVLANAAPRDASQHEPARPRSHGHAATAASCGVGESDDEFVPSRGSGRSERGADTGAHLRTVPDLQNGEDGKPRSADAAATTSSRQLDEQEEVRQLLSHAANVTMGTALHDVLRWWRPVDQQVAPVPAHVGMSDVAQVEALTAAMRTLDYQYGGGACRDAVAAQARSAQQLLTASFDDHTAARLHLALADLHNLAGWVSFDVGMYPAARKHFARALEQAHYAGNMSLAANVLYRMGRLHLHRGMYREALRFFQLGQIAAQDSGSELTVSMLCANEAWAYALLDDRRQMRRSISRAQDEFARADHTNPPTWVRFFGEADLHASIGVTLTALPTANEADLAESIDQVSQAVALRGPDMARSQIFELTALATAYLRAGDHQHGLDTGRQAVTAAAAVRSARTLDRLEPLYIIANSSTRGGDLRDLADEIATLRAAA